MSALMRVNQPITISDSLVEAVAALVARITEHDPSIAPQADGRSVRLEAPVLFPDGVGSGSVILQLHASDAAIDMTLRLEHDRVFVTPTGGPSQNRCFLNDFVASLTVDADEEEMPEKFVREVVAGVSAALTAVDRHNREHPAPWFRIVVAARDTVAV